MVLRDGYRRWLRLNPRFVDACLVAHKQGLLRDYIEGNPDVIAYIDRHVFLLLELLEHPKFRFDFAQQVKDGIIAAAEVVLPDWLTRLKLYTFGRPKR